MFLNVFLNVMFLNLNVLGNFWKSRKFFKKFQKITIKTLIVLNDKHLRKFTENCGTFFKDNFDVKTEDKYQNDGINLFSFSPKIEPFFILGKNDKKG